MQGDKYALSKKEAIVRLTARYIEQISRFPRIWNVPLDLYIKRNIRIVRMDNSLESYASEEHKNANPRPL